MTMGDFSDKKTLGTRVVHLYANAIVIVHISMKN